MLYSAKFTQKIGIICQTRCRPFNKLKPCQRQHRQQPDCQPFSHIFGKIEFVFFFFFSMNPDKHSPTQPFNHDDNNDLIQSRTGLQFSLYHSSSKEYFSSSFYVFFSFFFISFRKFGLKNTTNLIKVQCNNNNNNKIH